MRLTLPPHEGDHAKGPALASLTLIEYGDFQCPHTRKVYEWVEEIMKEESDLKFIFRHFPLVDLHTYAVYAALVSEGAAIQGKFWEIYKALLSTETPFNPLQFFSIAKEIGIDVRKLQNDLNKPSLLEKISLDLESGKASGVQSTPVFFLNGHRLEGPLGKEQLLENLMWVKAGRQPPP